MTIDRFLALAFVVLATLLASFTLLAHAMPKGSPAQIFCMRAGLFFGSLERVVVGRAMRRAVRRTKSSDVAIDNKEIARSLDIAAARTLEKTTLNTIAIAGLFVLVSGCGFAPPHHPTRASVTLPTLERCAALDDRTTYLALAGGALGSIGGGAGLVTVAVDDKGARAGLAVTAVVAAAIAIGLGAAAKSTANAYVNEGCGTPKVGP